MSLISRRKRLIEIGAEVVTHDRYVTFHVAEAAVHGKFPWNLEPIAHLHAPTVRY